jgi:hypothetical protein
MGGDITGWSARPIEPITTNETFNHNHHRPLSELKHRQHSHKIKAKARREH